MDDIGSYLFSFDGMAGVRIIERELDTMATYVADLIDDTLGYGLGQRIFLYICRAKILHKDSENLE